MIQQEGGKITLHDMENYEVIWSEPANALYGEYHIYGPGFPSYGGVQTIEALNLIEAAGLNQKGHYTSSPKSLFWLTQILRFSEQISFMPENIRKLKTGIDLSYDLRQKKVTAKALWKKMKEGKILFTKSPKTGSNHSGVAVAVDQWGNVAAIVHSINTVVWGETGIFVDGISIPDAATFQQTAMSQAGKGNGNTN